MQLGHGQQAFSQRLVIRYIIVRDFFQAAVVAKMHGVDKERLIKKFAKKYPDFKRELHSISIN